jgi:hypothetical protein
MRIFNTRRMTAAGLCGKCCGLLAAGKEKRKCRELEQLAFLSVHGYGSIIQKQKAMVAMV